MNRRSYMRALGLLTMMTATTSAQYSGGSGTESDPWQLATPADLIALGGNTGHYDDHFVMTADIDLTGHTFTAAVVAPWDPADPSGGGYFTGTFDGGGHVIRSLTINAPAAPSGGGGLFGVVDIGGEVRNLGLVDCSVTGGVYMAGLASCNVGTISSCYAIGSVTGDETVGGLVGFNGGAISFCHATTSVTSGGYPEGVFPGTGGLVAVNGGGEVSSCYANGSVAGHLGVGGLVGLMIEWSEISSSYARGPASGNWRIGRILSGGRGEISASYACGTVSGTNGVGGLLGVGRGDLSSSYASGRVSGGNAVGGLVGDGVYLSITSCYATGRVTGSTNVGGLVGGSTSITMMSCYATGEVNGDTDVGGLVGGSGLGSDSFCYFLDTAGPDNGYGTPLTHAEMLQQASFAGFDFVDVWRIDEGLTYPYLWWQGNCPDGDSDEDGLCDSWETDGIPFRSIDGTTRYYVLDVDGDGISDADPMHKDLFVELDHMEGLSFPQQAVDAVEDAFFFAPVPNPDGAGGITLHIVVDHGNIPFEQQTATPPDDFPASALSIKQGYFGTATERADADIIDITLAKAKAFRYCILYNDSSENIGGTAEIGGDDFVMFAGDYSDMDKAAVFMHELGHNLGLGHGGCDDINGKPNYPSIMNYVLAYETPFNSGFWRLDYSREKLATIDEGDLNETISVGAGGGGFYYENFIMPYHSTVTNGAACYPQAEWGQDVVKYASLDDDVLTDFNLDCDTEDVGVSSDLNFHSGSGLPGSITPSPGEVLLGHNDWANIVLRVSDGGGAFAGPVPTDELTDTQTAVYGG